MKISWPRDIEAARKVQEALRTKIRIIPLRHAPDTVAAVDAAYSGGMAIAASCLYAWPSLEYLEDAVSAVECAFPYIPGYLSFREGPAVLQAIEKLTKRPGMLFFDGQGIAHPRCMGIASHIGVLLDLPSVGCAKSRLVGQYDEPAQEKGSISDLYFKNNKVGAVVRTRARVKPLFVSPGHLIDIPGSVAAVLAATGRFRLPEPLRKAHNLTQKAKKMV